MSGPGGRSLSSRLGGNRSSSGRRGGGSVEGFDVNTKGSANGAGVLATGGGSGNGVGRRADRGARTAAGGGCSGGADVASGLTSASSPRSRSFRLSRKLGSSTSGGRFRCGSSTAHLYTRICPSRRHVGFLMRRNGTRCAESTQVRANGCAEKS